MSVYPESCTAFAGPRRIGSGNAPQVAAAIRRAMDAGESDTVLVFDDATGRAVDFDLRGTVADVLARIETIERVAAARAATPDPQAAPSAEPRGRGRPKLGVVAREVTLLPRHWDWLAAQPGGASAVLRRLVDAARREGEERRQAQAARDAAYHAMTALAGDLPGYEEALRALFAGDRAGCAGRTAGWPPDIRAYVLRLAFGAAP
jgi:hypothetical protein